jgi:hypothetical protein
MKPKYKLVGGLVLNEADVMPRDDSFDALRSKVASAISTQIRKGVDMDMDGDGDADMNDYAWVVDMYPTCAIYSMNGSLFSVDYSLSGDTVTLGSPTKVEVCYAPVVNESAARISFAAGSSLKESAYDKSSGKLTVTVIKPGFNSSKSRFYKESTLKKGYKVFEGAKMFVNHATAVEEKARPEGDVNQWVANLTKVWTESDGTIMGEAVVIDPAFKTKLDNLAEAKLLGEMGISIRAIGEAYSGEVDGVETNVVESFIAARSVDFVTFPGAGGRVEAIEADRGDANDVDLMTVAQLRERRPDLVQLVEAKFKTEMNMEKTVAQLQTELAESNRKNTELEKRITESEKASKKKDAAAELGKLLTESKLPEKAQARIRDRFKEAEDVTGMAEAIKEEREYIASVAPAPAGKGVKNLGESDQTATTEVVEAEKEKANVASLEKSFRNLGLSEAEAKIAAAGRS